MSELLDMHAKENGTKFLIYPQNKALPGFEEPEIVYIDIPPGTIKEGPEDDRIYVVDALNKRPFGSLSSPPFKYRYEGLHAPAVQPNDHGHFDHLHPGDRAFSSATMYATVRRVLDIWEDYFGQKIQWPWPNNIPKLLLIPRVDFNNAWSSSDGFIEFGYGEDNQPYCENFDVLAHELGHTIKYSIIGYPNSPTDEYSGHHEAFGDLISIISALHFNTVIDKLLNNTKGNLFSVNELERVGELANGREVREAFNYKKMSDVSREPHDLSEPFTGGAFDILIEIFLLNLINLKLIPKDLGDLAYNASVRELNEINRQFADAYNGNEEKFKAALINARDKFGSLMASAWLKTAKDKENFHYGKVLKNILEADKELFDGKYHERIIGCFDWREINIDTELEPLQFSTHIVNELGSVL